MSWKSRKFIMSVFVFATGTWLFAVDKLSESGFLTLALGASGAYLALNTISKFGGNKNAND